MKFLFALALVTVVSCNVLKSINDNLRERPELSSLSKLLVSPGFETVRDVLSSPGNFTLFAPNNAGVASSFYLAESAGDSRNATLKYHLLGSRVTSNNLSPLQFPNTLDSDPDYVQIGGKGQVLEIQRNSNGGIFIRDGARRLARVVVADILCSNGVVHIIDEVLIQPVQLLFLFFPLPSGLSGFDLFSRACSFCNLQARLNSSSLTVFAPSDEAFVNAGFSDLTIEELTPVLLFHIVPFVAYSTDIKNGMVAPTLRDLPVTLTIENGQISVNGANVINPNFITNTGVIHVIDQVLVPPNFALKRRK